MRFTLEQVVDFCWANKGKRAFKDFTYEQVAFVVLKANQNKMLQLVQDNQGLCGVLIFRVQHDHLFIDYLVTVREGFLTFLDYYQRFFNHLPIRAERKGKILTYTNRLCQPLRQHQQTMELLIPDSTLIREARSKIPCSPLGC